MAWTGDAAHLFLAMMARPAVDTPDHRTEGSARPKSSDAGFFRRVLTIVGVIAGALALWRLHEVVLLLFAAVLFAILLSAMAEALTRRTPLSSGWALGAAAVFIGLMLIGAGFFLVVRVEAQVSALRDLLPKAWAGFQARLGANPIGARLLAGIRQINPDPGWVLQLRGYLASASQVVADILLVLAAGLYLAAQPRIYRKGLLLIFPPAARGRIADLLDDCGALLRRWLVAELIAMLTIGVATTVGLTLLGVPAPLALGLFAGLAEFVPILGPIISAIPALLLALTQGLDKALWTLLLFVVLQQIEGNILQPLLQREVISLPPVLTLFALVTLGVLFGPLGVLLATPLTVCALILVRRLYVEEVLGEEPQQL